MFVPQDKMDQRSLKQGDIISECILAGAINLAGVSLSCLAGEREKYNSWTVPSSPVIGSAVVLSHSCELSPENGEKFTSIILAPLRDVNKATSAEKVQEIIESNNLASDLKGFSYLKYFYIPGRSELEFKDGSVVDFSKCFSARKKSLNYLLEKKILQMEDISRQNFSLKLALFFHRSGARAA